MNHCRVLVSLQFLNISAVLKTLFPFGFLTQLGCLFLARNAFSSKLNFLRSKSVHIIKSFQLLTLHSGTGFLYYSQTWAGIKSQTFLISDNRSLLGHQQLILYYHGYLCPIFPANMLSSWPPPALLLDFKRSLHSLSSSPSSYKRWLSLDSLLSRH